MVLEKSSTVFSLSLSKFIWPLQNRDSLMKTSTTAQTMNLNQVTVPKPELTQELYKWGIWGVFLVSLLWSFFPADFLSPAKSQTWISQGGGDFPGGGWVEQQKMLSRFVTVLGRGFDWKCNCVLLVFCGFDLIKNIIVLRYCLGI